MTSKNNVLLALFALALQGCSLLGDQTNPECLNNLSAESDFMVKSTSNASSSTNMSLANTSSVGTDDILAGIASRVSGFGGAYWDEQGLKGRLNIFLLNPDQKAAEQARDELAASFGSVDDVDHWKSAQVQAVQGQYDYIQLVKWFKSLKQDSNITRLRIVSYDIVSTKNRIALELISLSDSVQIRSSLTELNIPQEAVLLKKGVPANTMIGCEE